MGASNLGHVVLYTILNKTEGLLCDRSYLPGDDMLALLESKQRTLFAVESKRPLNHFDALGLSLAYELGAVNILEMLHLSKVPLTWAERDDKPDEVWDVDNGSWPLVFIGAWRCRARKQARLCGVLRDFCVLILFSYPQGLPGIISPLTRAFVRVASPPSGVPQEERPSRLSFFAPNTTPPARFTEKWAIVRGHINGARCNVDVAIMRRAGLKPEKAF